MLVCGKIVVDATVFIVVCVVCVCIVIVVSVVTDDISGAVVSVVVGGSCYVCECGRCCDAVVVAGGGFAFTWSVWLLVLIVL